jgi:hypothetical protein
MYSGEGTLAHANGDTYEGAFLEGQYNGKGELIYSDGSLYIGSFLNGEFNGIGVFILKDGSRLVANWGNGKRLGGASNPVAPLPSENPVTPTPDLPRASDATPTDTGEIPPVEGNNTTSDESELIYNDPNFGQSEEIPIEVEGN